MQAVKIGLARQTFAAASSNESSKKTPSNRKTRDKRKAMVESFITKYRNLNSGNYPSLSLTQKEVGGSFYTVREIMKEIKQETLLSSLSILPIEDQTAHNCATNCPMESFQAEGLNLATLTPASDYAMGLLQGSLVQNSNRESPTKCHLTTASQESRGEDIGKGKSFTQEVCLSDSEGNILTISMDEGDHEQDGSLCNEVFHEDLIDEAGKKVITMGQKGQEQVKIPESFSPVAERRMWEGMALRNSTGDLDPLFYNQSHVCGVEVETSSEFLRGDENLLNCQIDDQSTSNLPKEMETGESSFIGEQLENSCLTESEAMNSLIEWGNGGQIEDHNGHVRNVTVLSDSASNSSMGHHQPEAMHLLEARGEPHSRKVGNLIGGTEANHIALVGPVPRANVEAFDAEAGGMTISSSNSMSCSNPVPASRMPSSVRQRPLVSSAWKEKKYEWTHAVRLSRSVLYTRGNFPMKREELDITRKPDTNPLWAVMRAFLSALFQVLDRVMQVFGFGSKTRT